MSVTHALPSRQTMLRAVAARDPEWDGIFYVAVATTGIVCRPTCTSRPARPENLRFYPSVTAAHAAGFRSCKRCHPDNPSREPVWLPQLMTLVANAGSARITDARLSVAGLDPVAVRRHFHRRHGTTFHNWLRADRIAEAQRQLKGGAVLDQVIVTSSWGSHSGFREAFSQVMGNSPGRARSDAPIIAAVIDSPLGPLATAASDEGLILLEFGDVERISKQTPALQRWFKAPIISGQHRYLDQLASELDEYFAGTRREFTVPLVIRGTAFEMKVWQALREVPYGTTCSYGDIAREVGSPKAVRAVGSANGRNRMAIVIPCHRVVNTGGALGGYGGGLWRKKRLLEIEGRDW